MPTIDASVAAEQTETPPEHSCPACPHPRDDHDRISARFCDATVAGEFSRGCVCGR
jgi:hypothetical protein